MLRLSVLAVVAAVAVVSSAEGEDLVDLDYMLEIGGRDVSSFCRNITHNTTINTIGAKRLGARPIELRFGWVTQADFAASAVLGLVCRCAGVRSVSLETRDLVNRFAVYPRRDVMLATTYEALFQIPSTMEAVGEGVVSVAPRLHVRLAPDAQEEAECIQAFRPSFHNDEDMLRNCSLLTRFTNTTVYIPTEWSTVGDRDVLLYTAFQDILGFLYKHNITSQEYMSRAEFKKLVLHERNVSFLFVDSKLWEDVEGVWMIKISLKYFLKPMRSVNPTLRNTAPSLWDVIRSFTLNTSDIREILALNMDPFRSASTWALQRPDNRHRFLEWIHLSTKPTPLYMDVLLCDEFNTADYDFLFDTFSDKTTNLTIDMNYISINLEKYYINCNSEISWRHIVNSKKGRLDSYRSIRMVINGEGVNEIIGDDEKYLKKCVLALATNGSRPVFPLGGTTEALVQGLLQLLYNCSVRRIAVISEKSNIANKVTAALHRLHGTGLTSHDVQLSDTSEKMITDTLNSLVNYHDARIFLVNGDTRFANDIIRMAKKTHLTPEEGFLWIVREWEGSGDKTMKPYEVTFSYRGGDNVASAELSDLERQLNDRWRNSTWPRHAASVANAVLAVGIALTRLTEIDPDVVYNFYRHQTYRKLLEYSGSFPSMVGELRIEKQVVKNPRMFVYRWGGEYPTLVAGGAGPQTAGCPLSAPHDGSIACITSSDGDAFPPKCHDILWLIVGISTITFVLIYTITTIACRRASSRTREKRLIEEAENMGRARLDAFTSSLAPYFVERKALKLQHQIGAGRFGLVWLGILQEPTDGIRPVAAKALREGAVAEEQSEFFREARNLAVLQHDHVIRFVGVCVADGPPLLLMEHAFFGDLSQYLSNRRHLVESTETDSTEAQYMSAAALTRYTRDAAAALAFIVRRGFVHRDVRAVNCLVDERRMVKLADFGMTREISGAGNEQDGEYWCRRRALFPVLWMAPESLSRGVFSTASDIWSLGVLALEVSMLGARPYDGRSPLTVVELVVAGGRPPLPRDISAAARELLLRCWQRAPADRPTAADVVAWLEQNPLALTPALGDTRTVL